MKIPITQCCPNDYIAFRSYLKNKRLQSSSTADTSDDCGRAIKASKIMKVFEKLYQTLPCARRSRVDDISQSEFPTRRTFAIHFANTRLSPRADSRHTTEAFPLKAPRANALESCRCSRPPPRSNSVLVIIAVKRREATTSASARNSPDKTARATLVSLKRLVYNSALVIHERGNDDDGWESFPFLASPAGWGLSKRESQTATVGPRPWEKLVAFDRRDSQSLSLEGGKKESRERSSPSSSPRRRSRENGGE